MITYAFHLAQSLLRERVKIRSTKWPHVRDEYLKSNPRCEACGGKRFIQVHHKKPYHLRPELELDMTNLITLCMGLKMDHLRIGHGGDFEAFNPCVLDHVAKVATTPKLCKQIELEAKQGRLYEKESA